MLTCCAGSDPLKCPLSRTRTSASSNAERSHTVLRASNDDEADDEHDLHKILGEASSHGRYPRCVPIGRHNSLGRIEGEPEDQG